MGTRDEYVKAIKTAYVSISVRLTRAWVASLWAPLATGFPWLIIEAVARHYQNFLAGQTEMAAFFYYIDTRVGKQSQGFEAAAFENFRVQQTGTKEEKKRAEENLWKEFEPFARLAR